VAQVLGIQEKYGQVMQILLAILTVIGSGVSSGVVVYLLNARKEHVFFMRNKVEETCSAATEYMDAIFAGVFVFQRFLTDKDFKKMPDYLKLFTLHPKLRVNIRIYFPELSPQLDAVHRVSIEMQALNSSFLDRVGEQPTTALLEDYAKAWGELDEKLAAKFEALLAGIQAEARKYTGPEALRGFPLRERTAKLRKLATQQPRSQ
jgi:hypothetical protein